MPLCPIKWQPLKFFAKLHKSPLLISNVVKGAVSDLRQCLVIESPWKTMKNTFYFILTNWICYCQIRFCTYHAFSLNDWYSWSLKILTIKRWFRFNFAKHFTGLPFCGGLTKKRQTFSRHFFWERPLKYRIVELTVVFVCLLLSWSGRYSMKWSSNFNGP